jgi:hypothetical protein
MTPEDVARIGRFAAMKPRNSTVKAMYLELLTAYYAFMEDHPPSSPYAFNLLPCDQRPSLAQFRYWLSKTSSAPTSRYVRERSALRRP